MTKRINILFNLLALTTIIFVGVDIFYRVVRSQFGRIDTQAVEMKLAPDSKSLRRLPLRSYNTIAIRNIFGSKEKREIVEVKPEKVEEAEPLEPTALKIALLGTVAGDQKSAMAVIQDKAKRKQDIYRVEDTILGAVIKQILRGKVILRVGDKDEVLLMEEPSNSTPVRRTQGSSEGKSASAITLDRGEVEQSLNDINRLLTEVRIRPHFKNGEADGIIINRIKPNSLFTKLGLKNGDIIQGVNGKDITSPDDVMEFYENLKSGSQISLQLSRRGKIETINYTMK